MLMLNAIQSPIKTYKEFSEKMKGKHSNYRIFRTMDAAINFLRRALGASGRYAWLYTSIYPYVLKASRIPCMYKLKFKDGSTCILVRKDVAFLIDKF